MTADEALAKFAAKQGGAFTLEQARQAGITRSARRERVQAGRWIRLSANVFCVAGAPVTWRVRVFASVAGSAKGTVASHGTAAQLYAIPGFRTNIIEVTVPDHSRPAAAPARTHYSRRLPAHHIRHPHGIPTTSIARTLADLAATLNPQQTERALDNALTHHLVTTQSLWRVHHDLATPARPGLTLLRQLLHARGAGYIAPASELERLLLHLLHTHNLPTPEREIDLGDTDRWIGRVEFVYRHAKLLIEVDSRLHHTALLDLDHDRHRDNAFMASGWRVLRITYHMLTNTPQQVAALIRRALQVAA